ncbi:hypothetical protein AVEN_154449-1 [Araneus ventricosus]|uniref:Phospholipase A2 n=1 Tax=Araneus ventricosus TaxID=182803 RepID=A0A4Y2JXH5_ARAVE|nr:hypothetical protein AVEN_154449-1 [Araneus ventricosus]
MPKTLFLVWICTEIICRFAVASSKEWNVSSVSSRILSETEERRSIFQLGHMIRCQTGCDPLRYKRYGCFCGFKGAGKPVDNIDNCCLDHDWCYARLGCPPVMLYVLRYTWLCRKPGSAQCTGGNYANHVANNCAFQLCECDRLFAKCVSRYACPQKKAICWSNPLIAVTNILSSLS